MYEESKKFKKVTLYITIKYVVCSLGILSSCTYTKLLFKYIICIDRSQFLAIVFIVRT